MGTSTRWKGPRWSGLTSRLSRWDPDRSDPADAAASAIDALQNACRADPDAFGLREAAVTAGRRLTDTLRVLAEDGPLGLHPRPPEAPDGKGDQDGNEVPYEGENSGRNRVPDPWKGTEGPWWPDPADAFVAEFTDRVAGDGTTVVDAALRRAAVSTARRLLQQPGTREALGAPSGSDSAAPASNGLAGDLLCLLYRSFFADLISEFLRAVIAEQIDLMVPGLSSLPPEGGIPDKAADLVLSLVPNPCEEAAEGEAPVGPVPGEELSPGEDAGAVVAPLAGGSPLPEVARLLVPSTVNRVLGLITDASGTDETAATTPIDEEPSA